jgi:hypothetical protein
MQPESASFSADSGGGDGGGGSTGFGEELGFGPQGLGPQDDGSGAGTLTALGDGGLLSLLARARARYGAHAAELVQAIDISKMGDQSKNKKTESPNTNSKIKK